MYQLLIKNTAGEWLTADIGDTAPAMSFVSNNVAELENRQANYSQRVQLPFTSANARIFGFAHTPQYTGSAPYRTYECRLFSNGYDLAGKQAVLYLLQITATAYEVQIVSNVRDKFKELEQIDFADTHADFFGAVTLPFYSANAFFTSGNIDERASRFVRFHNVQDFENNITDTPVLHYGNALRECLRAVGFDQDEPCRNAIGLDTVADSSNETQFSIVPADRERFGEDTQRLKITDGQTSYDRPNFEFDEEKPENYDATSDDYNPKTLTDLVGVTHIKQATIIQNLSEKSTAMIRLFVKFNWDSSVLPVSPFDWYREGENNGNLAVCFAAGADEFSETNSMLETENGVLEFVKNLLQLDFESIYYGEPCSRYNNEHIQFRTTTENGIQYASRAIEIFSDGTVNYWYGDGVSSRKFEPFVTRLQQPENTVVFGYNIADVPNSTFDLQILHVPNDTDTAHAGQQMQIAPNIGFKNASELVKTYMQIFSLTPEIDNEHNQLVFHSFAELYNNIAAANVSDWSRKLQRATETRSFCVSNYERHNLIELKENKRQEYTESYDFQIEQPTEKEKKLFSIGVVGSKTREVQYLDSDKFKKLDAPLVGTLSYSLDDYYPIFEPLNAKDLATNYATLNKMLKRTVVIEADFALTDADVQHFDHFKPIYLEQFAAYFYCNEIKNYISGQTCKATLIKL